MKFRLTNRFAKDYSKLDPVIRERVDEKLTLFAADPAHPGLRDHRIQSTRDLREFRVTGNFRVVYRRDGGVCELLRVGAHGIIDGY
jgi:mRNA-degrading endonuclease YafQ of YafQ-DinJ toxin-antitoxin module